MMSLPQINCVLVGMLIILILWLMFLVRKQKKYIENLSKNIFHFTKLSLKNQQEIKESIEEMRSSNEIGD